MANGERNHFPAPSLSRLDSVELVKVFREGETRDREHAAQLLYERYAERLIAFTRTRLSDLFSGKLDADDVVQSAYKSFFWGAQQGQYTVAQHGDLWALLAAVTHRKIMKQVQHFRSQKRDVRKETLIDGEIGVLAEDPLPEHVAMFVEEVKSFLAVPKDPLNRQMLVLALQGHSATEIGKIAHRTATRVRQILKQYREPLERLTEGVGIVDPSFEDA